MSLTYAVAGIIVAVSGTNIQASLQNPYVIGAISLLFFIFALAMFKFFDIQMPKSIQTVMTQLSNKQKSGSYGDVAVMGVLSALIVGPCVTAPLIGALIYIASTVDVLVGGIALFSLGIGMGAPLILLVFWCTILSCINLVTRNNTLNRSSRLPMGSGLTYFNFYIY